MYTITIEKLKMFGEYLGFDENKKVFLYQIENKIYQWNRNGVKEVN